MKKKFTNSRKSKNWSAQEEEILVDTINELSDTNFAYRLASMRIKWRLNLKRTESACRIKSQRLFDPDVKFGRTGKKPERIYGSLWQMNATHLLSRAGSDLSIAFTKGESFVTAKLMRGSDILKEKTVNFDVPVEEAVKRDCLSYLSSEFIVELIKLGAKIYVHQVNR